MGRITELVKDYKAGKLAFEELKQKLVEFDWQDLKWPSGRDDDDDWMATDYPEQDTIEELEAAELDELLSPKEYDELYEAIVGPKEEEEDTGPTGFTDEQWQEVLRDLKKSGFPMDMLTSEKKERGNRRARGTRQKSAERAIKGYIDSASVEDVLEMIQQICYAEGVYSKTHWQDKTQAGLWMGIGRRLRPAIKYARDVGL